MSRATKQAVTVEIGQDAAETFARVAQETRRDMPAVLAEALEIHAVLIEQRDGFDPLSAEEAAEIRDRIAEVERGAGVSREEVRVRIARVLAGDAD